MITNPLPFARVICLIVGIAMLGACGDGGSGGAAGPVTPPPSPSPSPPPPPPPPPPPGARWQPAVADSWHWQLMGVLQTSVAAKVYDIDLFNTDTSAIAGLQARNIRVVCYFSAGSSEDFRADFGSFAAADMGKALGGFPNERWLDVRSANVRTIMTARLDLAKSKGCDGVEPDNVDGYTNDTGFALTAQDQLDFNRWLASAAHERGLAVGLKNDVDQLAALQPDFDFAVNEQCHEFSECGGYSVFITAGKPVFNAEYQARYAENTGGARDSLCAAAQSENLRTLVLPLELDGRFRFSCDPAQDP